MKKVTVIGAGFSGLTVALKLAQKGFSVEIFEKEARVGGLIGTDVTESGFAERAANSIIKTNKIDALFRQLELQPVATLKSSKKRFIFRGTPKKWPLNAGETFSFIAKFLPRFLFQRDSLKPKAQETLLAWSQQNLGEAPTRFLLEPAMQGIYANEISGLSSKLILSGLFNKNREKYRGILSGKQGMQDLINALEKTLLEMGCKVHKGQALALKDVQGPVVIATSAQSAAQLLKEESPEVSTILSNIKMSSVISTTLFFKSLQEEYKGFGCLIPRNSGLKTLGILFNSYIFEGRNKTYNETWIMGGVKEETLLDLSDTELLKLIAQERFQVLQRKDELLDYRINRWKNTLPYYDLNLESALAELEKTLLPLNVYLNGNYLQGIGLSKILERSEQLAEQIARAHG